MKHKHILCVTLNLACICSFIPLLPMQASNLLAQIPTSQTPVNDSCKKISGINNKLCVEAEQITVRVFPAKSDDNYQASGTLIYKQSQSSNGKQVYRYWVLTNEHVLKGLKKKSKNSASEYQIKTFDGNSHKASIETKTDWKENDLGLLHFSTSTDYKVARIGDSKQLKEKEQIFVSGFPCEENHYCEEFAFIPGQVFTRLLRDRTPLVQGYQIGFTNLTKDGMSGGPVLNQQGSLVGINGAGRNQEMLWQSGDPSIPDVNPYEYINGKQPSAEDIKIFQSLSWAIPIETYDKYKPISLSNKILPSVSPTPLVTPIILTSSTPSVTPSPVEIPPSTPRVIDIPLTLLTLFLTTVGMYLLYNKFKKRTMGSDVEINNIKEPELKIEGSIHLSQENEDLRIKVKELEDKIRELEQLKIMDDNDINQFNQLDFKS
jgi:Trypsin-like peptidase domain